MLEEYWIRTIESKTNELRKTLGLFDYPIKMLDVIRNHYKNIILECMPFDDEKSDIDVANNYIKEYGINIMIVNQNRIQPNMMKRLNFSLAHEIGHIELEHHKILSLIDNAINADNNENWSFYENLSQEEDSLLEYYSGNIYHLEQEADEFAGQLLAPNDLISMYSTRQIDSLSNYFFVSPKVIKIRFEVLEKLKPLPKSPKLKKSKEDLMNEIYNNVIEWRNKIHNIGD